MILSEILPKIVLCNEQIGVDAPLDQIKPVHDKERAYIEHAVDKRKSEFLTTRALMHNLLDNLGCDFEPILRGDKGEPILPKNVVGTMTHTSNYRGCAVAKSLYVRSLGIDAEINESIEEGVLNSIALDEEKLEVFRLKEKFNLVNFDKLLFCSKEATYKAWFPLTFRWLGFHDARISLEVDKISSDKMLGSFTSEILIDSRTIDKGKPLQILKGKWCASSDLIVTAISVIDE